MTGNAVIHGPFTLSSRISAGMVLSASTYFVLRMQNEGGARRGRVGEVRQQKRMGLDKRPPAPCEYVFLEGISRRMKETTAG